MRTASAFHVLAICVFMSAWTPAGSGGDGPWKEDKPASLPDFADLNLYDPNGPLNQKIPDAPTLHPNSAGYVGLIAQVFQQGGLFIEFKQDKLRQAPGTHAIVEFPDQSIKMRVWVSRVNKLWKFGTLVSPQAIQWCSMSKLY